jgi:hypothetical protein
MAHEQVIPELASLNGPSSHSKVSATFDKWSRRPRGPVSRDVAGAGDFSGTNPRCTYTEARRFEHEQKQDSNRTEQFDTYISECYQA